MHSWPEPTVPVLPQELVPTSVLELYDSSHRAVTPVDVSGPEVGMYVCGITPYDSTHLGHAATYLTFDLVYRQLLARGHKVHYVQNITDVDDPLFERAERDGVDWRELGSSQIDLFRSDMEALSVLPPRDYIGAMESVDEVVAMVQRLLEVGAAYQLEGDEYPDIYASIAATRQFGYESRLDRAQMLELFAQRGGDPERPGKRDPLDALLWRAERPGEPAWQAPFGAGRPGWHVECSAIATNRLGAHFAIQGGGSDLLFPHHEFSAAHAEAAHGVPRMANHYVHTGMIELDGEKMSKSLGNLEFVSRLRARGVHPSEIRLGLFAGHYRTDRSWSEQLLQHAQHRRQLWARACSAATDVTLARNLIFEVTDLLANDLNTPAALAAVDAWAHEQLEQATVSGTEAEGHPEAGMVVAQALDALLGVKL